MCGIFGYVGNKDPLEMALKGLKKLEYRGYDSAGLAGIRDHKLYFWKEVGKVSELEKEVMAHPEKLEISIAQTRWATHGGVTQANAHPHLDSSKKMALVHNGIIENFESLKSALLKDGVKFLSDTDTEVIVHLIAKHYQGDLLKAVQKTVPELKGSFSIALIHTDHPGTLIAVANECPLVIGLGDGEAFISSDYQAFAFYTREVIYLSHGEIAVVKAHEWSVYNTRKKIEDKLPETLNEAAFDISKGAFPHYTLKEIFEQPLSLKNALSGRLLEEYGTALFDDLQLSPEVLKKIERVLILGCGTSYNAGLVASYMIEELANIPVNVEISSEYRYKNPVVQPNTLVIAISQSGETADTIAALRELKAKGATSLAICNVFGSTITREATGTIYLKAGPEIGVCSTKAFTSQLAVLALLTLLLSRERHMTKKQGQEFAKALKMIPDQIKQVLALNDQIENIAKEYSSYENFFFLGRNYLYPTALEGALKLKEISYINANGYPAGEMKHGPISLINPDCPTVFLAANKAIYTKTVSNMQEVKARNGKIIAIVDENDPFLNKIVDDIIVVPKTIDPLAPLLSTVVTQLFAYYVAKERGCDIDQPRNLAKSVTVE